MALQSDHEFAPSEIARAAFPTAFRGYDQDAVRRYLSRLAAAVEHQLSADDLGGFEARTSANDRVDELESEVIALQDEIRELETELVQRSVDEADHGTRQSSETVEFDEHRAIELLGQETARVLESARSAASDILKRAENQAANLKAEAKKELAEARRASKELMANKQAEAEAAIDELTEEAERAADRVRTDAEDEANRVTTEADEYRVAVVEESSKVLADAERTAEAEQTGAQERARQIVGDAEALRHQVVAELVAERRSAHSDVEHLIEARDRLVLSLAVARSELDELTGDLNQVSGGTTGPGDGASVEVDGDEVARMIDHLEAGRTTRPAGRNSGEKKDSGQSKAAGKKKGARKKTSRSDDRRGRRSTVDEPTEEMPVVMAEAKADGETWASDETAIEPMGGLVDLAGEDPAVEVEPAGVFDIGLDEVDQSSEVIDLTDPELDADLDSDLDTDMDIGTDIDTDIDTVVARADVLNAPPADGVPLSLVEGFSTIVLGDEAEVKAEPAPEVVPVGVLVEQPSDPAMIVTTVAARIENGARNRTQGDLPIGETYTDRLPSWFGARDVAVTRSGANLRRQLRRALNDDQSEVLDRLRSGRGAISLDELRPAGEQIEHFLAPLRRGLADLARAGARAGGGDDVGQASLDNLIDQLATYIVDRVRAPTVDAIELAEHGDRERIMDPIRSGYRDFRNIGLPDLVEDALHEAFAVGLYDAIDDGADVVWRVDPRTDPDPVCQVNRDRVGLIRGEPFPSGHVRPLSLPGCRCLVVAPD